MRILSFVVVIITLSLLMACSGNLLTPLPSSTDEVTSIFAATLSATSSPFPVSTEILPSTQITTTVPNQTTSPITVWLIYPPSKPNEQFQSLYQLEFENSQWEIINDSSASFYGTIRNGQYLLNKDIPECAIIHTVGVDNLSSYSREQFVFLFSQTPINFDNSYYNIFIVAHSQDCLASGKQVLATLKKANIETTTPTP